MRVKERRFEMVKEVKLIEEIELMSVSINFDKDGNYSFGIAYIDKTKR